MHTNHLSTPPTKLQQALFLASLGFRVFPLLSDTKIPAVPDWPRRATNNPDKIRRFWTDPVLGWEHDHNIGVTGGTFLDIDNKEDKNGSVMLNILQDLHGDLPETLMVETPSGGFHFYFKEHADIRNSAGRMAPDIDVRGWHGYVVGPGSTIGDKAYRLAGSQTDVAVLPEVFVDLAKKATVVQTPGRTSKGSTVAHGVTLDLDSAINRAIDHLAQDENLAVEGASGDDTTYRVAARVKDFGVSEARCLELMLEHWNERCSPPWAPDELAIKVANAYRYGQEDVGSASIERDFPPIVEDPAEPNKASLLDPKPLRIPGAADILPRPWVFGRRLIKGQVSILVAPPGNSKSTCALHIGLAVVTGRSDILGIKVHSREAVWIFNNEDDLAEAARRISAASIFHKISNADLEINGQHALFSNSGDERPLRIAKWGEDNKELIPADRNYLIQAIIDRGIGVLIVDPFAETHPGNENSNEDVGTVARMFRSIAKRANCAVLIIHHTNKPPQASSEGRAGNMHTARGASSLMGVARIAMTLESMSERDALRYGIPEEERGLYIRLDDSKANMALMASAPMWFKKVSVPVPTRETAITLATESVGALELATLTVNASSRQECLIADVAEVLDGVSAGVEQTANALRVQFGIYSEAKDGNSVRSLKREIQEAFTVTRIVGAHTIKYIYRDNEYVKHWMEVTKNNYENIKN
ncbi:MAG: AAA family ATPase [Magnetococcales bacterium]|nr:AAA family ATPase [Magnetococcales bacterium]